jgi:hypothetical protein
VTWSHKNVPTPTLTQISLSEPGKLFFFEKKKQKTFICCRGHFNQRIPKRQKFFGSFFQKRTTLQTFGGRYSAAI